MPFITPENLLMVGFKRAERLEGRCFVRNTDTILFKKHLIGEYLGTHVEYPETNMSQEALRELELEIQTEL